MEGCQNSGLVYRDFQFVHYMIFYFHLIPKLIYQVPNYRSVITLIDEMN